MHIRRNRIPRSMAIEAVKRLEGKFPNSYLGKSLQDILKPLDLTTERFIEICDEFTNKTVFKLNQDGSLYKDSKGNLVKRKYDNE
jgi:hypothetical protein